MTYGATGSELPPVEDWVNDWDWLDDQWGANAIEIWNDVREQCPVASTERYGRAFMPVTMEGVSQVARDTESFSSIWVNVSRPDAPRIPAPPITSDPPEHQEPSPAVASGLQPEARGRARARPSFVLPVVGGRPQGKDIVDASAEYSQHIPVHGICLLTGLPEADADLFRDWIYRNFQIAPRDNSVRKQVNDEMTSYIDDILNDRLRNPVDDMLTEIANAEIEDEPVDWDLKVGYIRLLIIAGIDTTWSAIGSGLWHFAQHPDQVARLVETDDNMLWDSANEEVLRYYAPVTMGRKVVADTEVAGCPVHAGDQMLLTFPAANHDPEAFEDPEEFQIDRARNRHVAFGLGVHRCVGSNLARLEMVIAMQEWLRAFPNYRLDPDQETKWANGQVRGPRYLPVQLNS